MGTIAQFPTIALILANAEIGVVFCLTDTNIDLRTCTGHIYTESANYYVRTANRILLTT